jgi:hypothetical protein
MLLILVFAEGFFFVILFLTPFVVLVVDFAMLNL